MASLFSRLKKGLSRSRGGLAQMLAGRDIEALSEENWMDIEDGLIMADCGAGLTAALVQKARKRRGGSIEILKESMKKTRVSSLPCTCQL